VGQGSLAQDFDAEMVEQGKAAFGEACTVCHGPAKMMLQRKDADRWRKTVYTMTSRGAPVLPGEAELITAYLTANYGPDSPLPRLGEESVEGGAEGLPAGEGRAIVVGVCSQCHPIDLILASRKSSTDWKETLATMRDFGADVRSDQEKTVVEYLSQHFGAQ